MGKEAYYFSHDRNARNDEKILAVRMKYGAEGYGIYFMLIERLSDSTDYTSVKDYNLIAFDLRVDAGKVKSIVEDFGLFVFTEGGKYFYSESLNNRLLKFDTMVAQRSEAGKKSAARRAMIKREINNRSTTVEQPLSKNPTKESKVKESKVKESKVKESKEGAREEILKNSVLDQIPDFTEYLTIPEKWNRDLFRPAWDEWKRYLFDAHDGRHYTNLRSEQTAIEVLYRISSGDLRMALRAIETSIARQYKAFYEEQNNKNGVQKFDSKNFSQLTDAEQLADRP